LKLPIVFDTDCISSFLWVKRLDVVKNLFPNQIIIPQTVYDELNKIQNPQYRFLFNDLLAQVLNRSFKLKDIMVSDQAFNEYRKLISIKNPKRIGKGEAAAIVIARIQKGTLASNNLSDILPYVGKNKLPYIRTDNILYLSYKKNYISIKDGNQLWNDMKLYKRLPNCDFKEIVRRFEINNNQNFNNDTENGSPFDRHSTK
jgi:predicted nucleic acid-binding protein